MNLIAVIDTNVIVAALLSKNEDSATVQVVNSVLNGTIIPVYNSEILSEYEEVLKRPKFNLNEKAVISLINAFRQFGFEINPESTGEILPDKDDLIFYEVAFEEQKDNAYLVTGNLKHYPVKSFIVTPAEMIKIISENTK